MTVENWVRENFRLENAPLLIADDSRFGLRSGLETLDRTPSPVAAYRTSSLMAFVGREVLVRELLDGFGSPVPTDIEERMPIREKAETKTKTRTKSLKTKCFS